MKKEIGDKFGIEDLELDAISDIELKYDIELGLMDEFTVISETEQGYECSINGQIVQFHEDDIYKPKAKWGLF